MPSLQFWLSDLRAERDEGTVGGAALREGDEPAHEARAPLSADDRAALDALRHGDTAAFEQLYVKFYPRLLPYAVDRVHDRDVAAEIVHDVFLAIWRRRETFTVETTLTSYLYVAVRNRAMNARKVAARDAALRSPALTVDALWDAQQPEDTEADLARADLVERIWDEVAKLPETRREAITLRWRHGLAPEEIAAVLGVSVAAGKMQVSRALKSLRERLADLVE